MWTTLIVIVIIVRVIPVSWYKGIVPKGDNRGWYLDIVDPEEPWQLVPIFIFALWIFFVVVVLAGSKGA